MAVRTTLAVGVYSAAGTWIGGVPPGPGDSFVLNHAVTVDGTYTTGDGSSSAGVINGSGALIASRTVNSSLMLSGWLIANAAGATFDYGTDASPIPTGVNATINVSGEWYFNRENINVTVKGATATRRTTMVSLAGTALVVADATGWVVGGYVVIASILKTDTTSLQRIQISAIAGNNVTLASAPSGTLTAVFTKVGYLSSNVTLAGNGNCYIYSGYIKNAEFGFAGGGIVAQGFPFSPGGGSGATQLLIDACAGYIGFNTGFGGVNGYAKTQNSVIYWPAAANSAAIQPGSLYVAEVYSSLLITGGTVSLGNDGNSPTMYGPIVQDVDAISSGFSFSNRPMIGGRFTNVRVRDPNSALNGFSGFGTLIEQFDATQLSGSEQVLAAANGTTSFVNLLAAQQIRATASYATIAQNGFIESLFETIAGTPNQHEYVTRTGALWAAIDQKLNGATSISMYRRAGSAVQSYTQAFPIAIGETKRIRFNARRNATYAAGGMPTVSLSMPGVTTVTVTPTDTADAWFPQTLSLTNTTGAAGQITITVQWQGALSASSAGWIDGLALYPYVTQARWYGDVFDESNPFRVVDMTLTLNEAAAAAITGVAINHGAQTITVTAARTAQQVYCYCKWNLCQTANLSVANHITSTGGQDFTTTYTVILSGAGAISAAFYTDATGTVRTVMVSSTGLPVGARYQLYNVTDAVELLNAVSAGQIAYSLNFTITKTLRLRWAKLGSLPQELTASLTVGGANFLCTDNLDTVYVANGINGALTDASNSGEFSADYPNVQIDTSDPDGVTSVQRVYAWSRFINTTSMGIQLLHNAITSDDVANYLINVAVVNAHLQNTVSGGVVIIGGGYLRRSDGTTVIASGPGSIQMDPGRAYLAGGSVVDANIIKVNGYTVDGTGTDGDPWGPV